MRLRTAFLVAGLIASLLFVIGVVAFVEGYGRVARMAEIQRVAGVVIGDGRHLALRGHELILEGGSPWLRAQWRTLHHQIAATLSNNQAVLQPPQRQVDTLAQALKTLDGQLANYLDWLGHPASSPDQEAIRLRAGQVALRIAELQSALDELEQAVRSAVEAQLGTSGQGLVTNFALLFALYALVAVAAGGFYYRRLHRPLTTLESGIHRIRDGDRRFRPSKEAPDEIGSVVDAFNELLDRREEAEAALRHSREGLNEAQHLARLGSWELDLARNLLTWSDQVFRLFELDRTRFGATYDAFLAAVHPDDREAVTTAYTRSLETRQPYEITHRLLMPDGRIKHVHERCETSFDPDGRPLRSLGTVQDITERVRLQDALRRERDFAEGLIDIAPVIILVLDHQGDIVRYNRYLEQLCGWPLEEMRGRPWIDTFLPARERQRIRALLASAVTGERTRGNVNPILTRGGEERMIEWYDRWLDDGEGHPSGLLAIGLDVTKRLRAETELDAYRHGLEDLVAKRTAELELAKESAEAANRAKSVFLANMSHELRTPLNAILGFAQILERDERIPSDGRRNIAIINRSGGHLLALINDVLEISRIEAGRTRVTHEPFDLAATLSDVAEMIRVRADAKDLSLRVERDGGLPPWVLGDAHHLRQVLINLLGNAVKFTDQGQIGLRVEPDGEGRIRFAIADTGPGIPQDEQEHIFQPFYQTEIGVSKGEGTGLGLPLSREFVRLMGGELKVESRLGAGSTFRFSLPLPPCAALTQTAGGRVLGLAAGQPPPRILVAEDQADNQQVAAQLLGQIGCQVALAGDGRQALAQFQSWRPDLILMDMRMPVLDGYGATRAIRALPDGDRLPIVALTASAFEEDLAQVLAAGCNALVRKPFEEGRLFEVIGGLLGLRFTYGALPAAAPPSASTDLAALPTLSRQALAEAALALDREAILVLAEGLRADYPAEAGLIWDLVEGYQFDRIEALSLKG